MKNIHVLGQITVRKVVGFSLALLLGTASCDVTTVEPEDRISETQAYSTPSLIELSVVGMYDAASTGFYDRLDGTAISRTRGYPFGAATITFGDVRGEDAVDRLAFYGVVYRNNITPTSPNVVNLWANLYTLINTANLVVEGVRAAAAKGVISEEQARSYEGEGRMMRAMAHFELLLYFARPYKHTPGASHPGVPYRDFGINSTETITKANAQGRNMVAEVYSKILEDLDYAETNLPANRTGALKVNRATKGAAIAFKTRVRLHQGDWAKVIEEGNKLISPAAPFTSPVGGYQLTAAPQGPFTSNTSTESIFSMAHNAADNPGTNGTLARMWGNPAATGRGLVFLSPGLYNAPFWPATDLRRTQLLAADASRYYSNKYRDITNQTDWAPIMRYAEVLLNVAEATARTTNSVDPRAIALLGEVRNRAATNPADQYTVASFSDAKSLIEAVLNERRIEFFAEGFRWQDIHRLANDPDFTTNGIPPKVDAAAVTLATYNVTTRPNVPSAIAGVPYTDPRFIWPLPSQEIANNPTLAAEQNPGY